jgi:hypothetical protein
VQRNGFFSRPAPLLGIAGLILALYGSIAVIELTNRAEIGQEFLSTGTPAVADQVELEVGVGKGAPFLGEVQVVFTAASRQSIRTYLVWIDVETQITRNEERQTPEPGSGYAPPLRILYKQHDPSEAIAVADAERLVANRNTYRGRASACIGIGLVSLTAAAIILMRQRRTPKTGAARTRPGR